MPETGSDSSAARAGTDISHWLRRPVTRWRRAGKMVKSAPGPEPEKALASGFARMVADFSSPRSVRWLFFFPWRERESPQEMGDLLGSLLKKEFSAGSEKRMPLCSSQGGTAGSSLCPAVGLISDSGTGRSPVRFSPAGSPVLQLSPRREGSLCQQSWGEAAHQAAITPAAAA